MRRPDFSKQAMKRFFLYHTEKLILAASFGLMGLFFWMGYGSEVFKEKTPKQLADLAKQADQHIISPTSWEKIEVLDQRKADDQIKQRMDKFKEKVETQNYLFGPFTPKASTLELRSDPRLFKPTDLIAQQITCPVLLSPGQLGKVVKDSLDELPLVTPVIADMGMEPGFGEMDAGFDEFGSGRSTRKKPKKPKPGEERPEIKAGDKMLQIHQYTMEGVRPTRYSLNPRQDKSFAMTVVAVTGLVNIKQQAAEYEKSFASGIGFYPDRDRPIYEYMQVERSEVVAGKVGNWQDITENISTQQPSFYPSRLLMMPGALFPSAPEFIAANYYDPVLTAPIPPLSQTDYRPLVSHPKIENRKFDSLPTEQQEEQYNDPTNADGTNRRRGPDFDSVDVQRNRGGMPGGGFGGGMDGFDAYGQQIKIVRAGSDVTRYVESVVTTKPTGNYKLVRFFDLQARPGVTYQYRVRVWLKDPNHEPTAEEIAEDQAIAALGVPGGGGGGLTERYDVGPGAGFGEDMASQFGSGQSGEELGPDGLPLGPKYELVDITYKMKSRTVRDRLNLARKVKDPKNRLRMIYYVSEFRKAEDGSEVKEEVQVPKDWDKLRYARPSDWSQPVEIAVIGELSEVVAGKIQPSSTMKINDKLLPSDEPVSEVVPMVWSRKFSAALPARKKAHRADALDFSADIHVLNSITWGVHVYQNAPILSNTVVVDMLGGEELPLPRTEMKRYHLPSEVLILNADGSFHVANDMNDKTRFKQLLLEEDDLNTVGGEKAEKQRQKDFEAQQRAGGFGP